MTAPIALYTKAQTGRGPRDELRLSAGIGTASSGTHRCTRFGEVDTVVKDTKYPAGAQPDNLSLQSKSQKGNVIP